MKKRTVLHIDPDLHTRLKELCRAHGLKITFVAERAVERELERIESAALERSERIRRANGAAARAP
jgi:predicted transcriptional regulator